MKQTVLAVVAHPDDEAIGCGGTLRRHADQGDDVYVCFLADGETSRVQSAQVDNRESAALRAAAILGVKEIYRHRLPDNRLDSVDLLEIVRHVESHVNHLRPTTLYTHHAGDLNVDHRLAHMAAMTASRPQPGSSVSTILFFETASSTEWQSPASHMSFAPNWFVDIGSTLAAKQMALDAYDREMRDWPHARSTAALTHLARWRGSSVGVEAAEAFMLGRRVVA